MLLSLLQTQPETATWLDTLLQGTIVLGSGWLAYTSFVSWRRSAANLTPVAAAPANGAQPGFLGVDHDGRKAAFERADQFEASLDAREKQAAEESRRAKKRGGIGRVAGLASLFMSIFSLLTLIAGAVWQVTWIGTVWGRYTASERLVAVMKDHPFAFAVCVIVIAYHVISFFVERPWRSEG